MFENFGIMDIWSGFKKYKLIILTFIAVSFAFFVVTFLLSFKRSSANSEINEDTIYISSASYYIEPSSEVLLASDPGIYRAIPSDYVAMLKTDFFRKYIFEKLTAIYSKQFIVENSGLNKSDISSNPETMGIDSMNELYVVKQHSGSMVVEIFSMTYNEALSNSVQSICKEFLSTNVDEQTRNSSIKFTGEANRVIKTSDLASEKFEKDDTRNIIQTPTVTQLTFKLIIKKILVPVFLVVFLCFGFVILMGLFRPTLNRVSDFSEYDVPVIGEIKNYKAMKGLK